jgi:hypothetical protein
MQTVRTVALELLRKGPPHNQLLSPLTDYLGLCGNNGATTVHVPYEHEDFLPILQCLRYQDDKHNGTRHSELGKVGIQIGQILGSVSGFNAELNTFSNNAVLTHLTLVLSASELALLPFELSKVPPGCPGGEGNWLLLQTRSPISLTRQVRTVSNKSLAWPRKPKILFVSAAPGAMKIPLMQHTRKLLEAIFPWLPPFDETNERDLLMATREIMTIIPNATIEKVERACATSRYTHVHVLAHGMEDSQQPGSPYGLAFQSSGAPDRVDVVSGMRFATALSGVQRTESEEGSDGTHLPMVVTVASCDSGYVSSVVHKSGASLAHELHQAGIPFVVGSQFPLSFKGSIRMVDVLYKNLLWGEDPRIVLHGLRRRLYSADDDTHDWASVICYAALPDDMEMQLQDVRYEQAREAINMAMKHIDAAIDKLQKKSDSPRSESLECKSITDSHLKLYFTRVDNATRQMPITGRYETEGRGLLASTEKRKAEACQKASAVGASDIQQQKLRSESLNSLTEALRYYEEAFRGKMARSAWSATNRNALHWVLCQYLSLRAILGHPFLREHWGAAVVAAQMDLESDNPETRGWAHSTLAELYLIVLTFKEKELSVTHHSARANARKHVDLLVELRGRESFEVYATRRQFRRYTDWWCTPAFERDLLQQGIQRGGNWRDKGGVCELAEQLIGRMPKEERKN